MAKQLDVNEEALINLVRENECLYDLASSSYKSEAVKQNCWAEIGKALNLSSSSLSSNEVGML